MSRQRVGVYPGTFDPITLGHMDIIRRGAKLVDKLVIGVTTNISKSPMFADEERLEMVRRECADIDTDIDTDAISYMGNIVVPIRRGRLAKWRPYGTAGLGVIRGWTNEREIDRHQNDFGFNVGGGVTYPLGRRVGLRGDVRYLRALVDEDRSANVYVEDYGFWRVTVGVAVGFAR